MLELRRSLADQSGNELSKIFHIELKNLIRKSLEIVTAGLPEPEEMKFEHHNTPILLQLRNDFLQHENSSKVNEFKAISNFIIMLYDSDEFYRQRVDWLIKEIGKRPIVEGEKPDPRWWKE